MTGNASEPYRITECPLCGGELQATEKIYRFVELFGIESPYRTPKFANVSCSQCGEDFGPGDHGYSHCSDHQLSAEARERIKQAIKGAMNNES